MYGTKYIKISLLFLLLSCAKKMLPPSPDKFPPQITEKKAIYRNTYLIKFNEILDSVSLNKENFEIQGEGIIKKPLLVSFYRNPDAIVIYSHDDPQKVIIKGEVLDTKKNKKKFSIKIKNIDREDTLSPFIKNAPEGWLRISNRASNFFITFSEPLDSKSTYITNYSIPEIEVNHTFNKTYDRIDFSIANVKDSILYSLLIKISTRDIAGNELDTFLLLNPFKTRIKTFKVYPDKNPPLLIITRNGFFSKSSRDYILVPADSLNYKIYGGMDYSKMNLLYSGVIQNDSIKITLKKINPISIKEIINFVEK